VQILDLADVGLADRGGAKFFETLLAGKCNFIRSFHLGNNKLTDLAVGPLIVEVPRSEGCNISTLDINNNQIGAPVITQAIKYNRSMTNLDIRECPIDDDGLGNIGRLLLEPDCMCRMRYISCDAFDIKDGATELKIHKETLGPGETRLLCGVFKSNNLIKQLDLSGRGIECEAATVLATALTHNTTLKALDLSNNAISTVSNYVGEKPYPIAGLNALADAVKASASLDAITLEGGKLPVDQLKGTNKKVRLLDLSRKSLSFVSSIFIGTLLSGNTFITELILHSNELTPNGATIVVKQLSRSLKTLDIANIVRVEERGKAEKKADKGKAVVAARQAEYPPEQLVALWAAVSQLSSLEKLTMDKDQLKELDSLGRLLSLKNFSVSNNKLTALPGDINLIRGLKYLTLHGNSLKELHPAVGELEMLEKIDLRSNQLTFLPASLSKLRNLKQLDASENLIQTLHPSICDLHALERLELKDNPLARPPATVCRQGLPAVRKYFQEITMTGEICAHGARLIVVGGAKAGKTTLERALRGNLFPPTLAYEPTNDVDINCMVIGGEANPAKQVWLTTWDLSGELTFDGRLQPLYVEGSIYALVVPALEVSLLNAQYQTYVGRWLTEIQMGAPTAIILPIITQCDKLPSSGSFKDTSAAACANQAAAQVTWLKEQLQAYIAKQPPGGEVLKIQPEVMCVSSVSEYAACIDELKRKIESLVYHDPPLLPTCNAPINRTMVLSTVFLRALRDGRDPIDSARATDLGYIPSTMSTDPKPFRAFIEREALNRIFADEFVPALKIQLPGDPAAALADAIKLLANQGECIFAPSGIVYLQPDNVSRVVKPLCDARMGNRLWQARELTSQDALRTATTGFSVGDAERAASIVAAEELAKKGIVNEELMPCLWETTSLKRDDYGTTLRLLAAAGLIWLADSAPNGRRWLMPMRLPEIAPNDAKDGWSEGMQEPGSEVLSLSIALGVNRPSGVFERFAALCYGIGTFRKAWRRGVHIEVNPNGPLENVSNVLLEVRQKQLRGPEGEDRGKTWELCIEGVSKKSARAAAFSSLKKLHALAQTAIDDVPGLASLGQATLICPGCVRQKSAEPSFFSVDDLGARKMTCEKTGEVLALHNAPQSTPLNLLRHMGMPLLLPTHTRDAVFGIKDSKFCATKLRFGQPLETQVSLYKQIGLAAESADGRTEEGDKLKVAGEQAIHDEIQSRNAELGDSVPTDGPNGKGGWTDLDWLRYLTAAPAAAKGTTKANEYDAEDAHAKALADKVATLRREAKERGFDAGRADSSLDFWMKRPLARPHARAAPLRRRRLPTHQRVAPQRLRRDAAAPVPGDGAPAQRRHRPAAQRAGRAASQRRDQGRDAGGGGAQGQGSRRRGARAEGGQSRQGCGGRLGGAQGGRLLARRAGARPARVQAARRHRGGLHVAHQVARGRAGGGAEAGGRRDEVEGGRVQARLQAGRRR